MDRKPFSPLALAAVVAAVLGAMVTSRDLRVGLFDRLPLVVLYGPSVLYLLTVLVLIFVWKSKFNKGSLDTERYTAFWQNAVRYFLALDMVMFGVQKFFHLQFSVPLGMLDDPFTAIPNELLMWAFMGRYHSMVDIIAVIEITGGLLLLFRKTRLVGAFVLLPLLLNLALLDYYYLNLLVQAYVTLELLAVVYLILLEYRRLVEFFFMAKSNLPVFNFRNKGVGYLVKASAVLVPLLMIAAHKFPKNYSEITGKYIVKSFTIDNAPQNLSACADSVLAKVFIDRTDFVFGYKNWERKAIGNYQYNPATKEITVAFTYPEHHPDTLKAKIIAGVGEAKVLSGHVGKQQVKIDMVRVAPVNN